MRAWFAWPRISEPYTNSARVPGLGSMRRLPDRAMLDLAPRVDKPAFALESLRPDDPARLLERRGEPRARADRGHRGREGPAAEEPARGGRRRGAAPLGVDVPQARARAGDRH